MKEKMLVTQALDERDLLVKKINDKITKIQAVDTKKRNEEKTVKAHVTVEEFNGTVSAAFQQIMDLIDRYQRLDAAIVASNAATKIQTSQGEYTVAGAIALRNRLRKGGIYEDEGNFESKLSDQLEGSIPMQYLRQNLRIKCLIPRQRICGFLSLEETARPKMTSRWALWMRMSGRTQLR